MVGVLEVAGAALVSGWVVRALDNWRGCTRGHVWGEWEDCDRWKITPFDHKDSVIVERKRERTCTREDCSASESEYQQASEELYSEDCAFALDNVIEAHYECPSCNEHISASGRTTAWKTDSQLRGTRHYRNETCPNCGTARPSDWWDRVRYEEVMEEIR